MVSGLMTVPRRPGTTVAKSPSITSWASTGGILQSCPQRFQYLVDDLRVDRELDMVADNFGAQARKRSGPHVNVTSLWRSAFRRVTGPARMSWAVRTAWSTSSLRQDRLSGDDRESRGGPVKGHRLLEDEAGGGRAIDLLAGPRIPRLGHRSVDSDASRERRVADHLGIPDRSSPLLPRRRR